MVAASLLTHRRLRSVSQRITVTTLLARVKLPTESGKHEGWSIHGNSKRGCDWGDLGISGSGHREGVSAGGRSPGG